MSERARIPGDIINPMTPRDKITEDIEQRVVWSLKPQRLDYLFRRTRIQASHLFRIDVLF